MELEDLLARQDLTEFQHGANSLLLPRAKEGWYINWYYYGMCASPERLSLNMREEILEAIPWWHKNTKLGGKSNKEINRK